jgi:hypothetical protein
MLARRAAIATVRRVKVRKRATRYLSMAVGLRLGQMIAWSDSLVLRVLVPANKNPHFFGAGTVRPLYCDCSFRAGGAVNHSLGVGCGSFGR